MHSPTNLAAFRITAASKRGLLAGETRRIDTRPGKLEAAIAWLGTKYVCHKINRVAKLAEPLPEFPVWKPKTLKGKK